MAILKFEQSKPDASEEIQELLRILKLHNYICICGNNTFTFESHSYMINKLTQNLNIINNSDYYLPCAVMVCNTCSNVQQYSLSHLKVFESMKKSHSEKSKLTKNNLHENEEKYNNNNNIILIITGVAIATLIITAIILLH